MDSKRVYTYYIPPFIKKCAVIYFFFYGVAEVDSFRGIEVLLYLFTAVWYHLSACVLHFCRKNEKVTGWVNIPGYLLVEQTR